MVPIRRIMQCGALTLLIMLLATSGQAKYIWVPADFPTIQAGIDAAVDGDSVEVSYIGVMSGPGNRDIDFKGKRIFVNCVYPSLTTIDCGGTPTEHHGGFIFKTAEDSGSVLHGFTITNAYYPTQYSDSGAITVRGSSPTITECMIKNNRSHGITITGQSAPNLANLQITSNDGWGIWMPGYPYLSHGVKMTWCQIDHNVLGGVIVTRAIESTLVAYNTIAENGGTGLFLQGDLPARMQSQVWDSTTIVDQNIIAFNAGMGIYAMGFFPGPKYHNNDLFGNAFGNSQGLGTDTGCIISVDPRFCRGVGSWEFGLAANSPCLAANSVCGVDMGAFGLGCTSCCIGMLGNVDCDPEYVIDISDLSRLIDFLYISLGRLCCPEAANVDGVGLVDIGDLTRLIDYLYISLNPPGNCQ